MTINQRLVSYLNCKKIKQSELEHLGYTNKQTAHSIWHGRVKPNCDFLEALIAGQKDLNVRWLFTGEGDMISDNIPPINNEFFDYMKEKDAEIGKLRETIGELRFENRQLKNEIKKYPAENKIPTNYVNDPEKKY